jgi:serine/threonine protein kinase
MVIIGKKYELIELIGSGNFGKIYKGKNIRTNEDVAIKMESIHCEIDSLKHESKIYQYLNGSKGIPILKWYGCDIEHHYMVINLLGDSISKLQQKHEVFSLEVTKKIGINVLKLLKTIHEKGLVHRDIKPDNFLFGLGELKHNLHIIDFGLCKRYTTDEGKHIEMKKISKIIGSLNYCSINAHNLRELSRRDDLESLGYMLIKLSCGNLIWEKIDSPLIVKERKELLTSSQTSIPGIPNIFINYLKYIQTLEFEEKPDYEFIENLFLYGES